MELIRSKEEYLSLRQEILQYMNNYQAVRNMMYASTLTCLGLGMFFVDKITMGVQYFFLLPLVVIMPSFLVAVNFWKSVIVDSCYLRVFYEDVKYFENMAAEQSTTLNEAGQCFRWETRHSQLFKNNPQIDDKINVQHIPYLVCAACCIGMFWWMLFSSVTPLTGTNANPDMVAIIVGIVVSIGCLLIFVCKWNLDTDGILKGWKELREAEMAASTNDTASNL